MPYSFKLKFEIFDFEIPTARLNQPAIKLNPPSGVIGPNHRGPPTESAYKLPLKSIMPIIKSIALRFSQRRSFNSTDKMPTKRSAKECIK